MKPSTKIAIAGLLSAAGAVLSAFAAEFSGEAPASAEAAATPEPEKKRGRKPAAEKSETPADPAPEQKEEAAAEEPAGKTYEELRALIKPLVENGQGAEVKAVIAKYATSLKEIAAKDHAAFEKDIAALSY